MIDKEQVEFLRGLNFSWNTIASILGISRTTLYERRRELNIMDDNFSSISDEELADLIRVVKEELPERMMVGILHSKGVNVQRRRVREAIYKVDPIGVSLHWSKKLYQRQYTVPGPNSLWHLGLI